MANKRVNFLIVKDATYDAVHDLLKNRSVKIYQMPNAQPNPIVRVVFAKMTQAQVDNAKSQLDGVGATYQLITEDDDI